jgi:hypothetical protein
MVPGGIRPGSALWPSRRPNMVLVATVPVACGAPRDVRLC